MSAIGELTEEVVNVDVYDPVLTFLQPIIEVVRKFPNVDFTAHTFRDVWRITISVGCEVKSPKVFLLLLQKQAQIGISADDFRGYAMQRHGEPQVVFKRYTPHLRREMFQPEIQVAS